MCSRRNFLKTYKNTYFPHLQAFWWYRFKIKLIISLLINLVDVLCRKASLILPWRLQELFEPQITKNKNTQQNFPGSYKKCMSVFGVNHVVRMTHTDERIIIVSFTFALLLFENILEAFIKIQAPKLTNQGA